MKRNVNKILSTINKRIFVYLRKIYRRLKDYKHSVIVYHRLLCIRRATDITMGDKLRTIAAKIDAIEQYGCKYCDPEHSGRLDARYNKKYYNKLKNDIKKELLLLLYNY